MTDKFILLVEDDPDDQDLTLRALAQQQIHNDLIVVRDGVEALDFFFGTGAHAGRDVTRKPSVTLLDLKLPKVDGLEVLRRLRADERTKLVPIVVLTSSNEEQDLLRSYGFGANSYIRKAVDFDQFVAMVGQIGLYWLNLNEAPP
jgi:two-component system response regulator